jgi:DNA-directed RNA polymerase specialized sigma24 family protein
MASALEEVANTADEAAETERAVAREARAMQAQRDRGHSWSAILEGDGASTIFELLRRGARLAIDALSALSRVVTEELSEEGASRRQIARFIGVSHQRVSAIIGRGRRNGAPSDDADGGSE